MNHNEFNNNVYPNSKQNIENGYTQQPTQNLNGKHYTNITPEKGNKNITKILFIIMILLALGGIAFAGYTFFFKDKTSNGDFDVKAATSFFLQNADSKYALFNEDGKQLTEFIYKKVNDFVNGTADVRVDDQEGIINTSGKMIVPLGKYNYIERRGGQYSVRKGTGESYHKYLIDGKGKILYDLDGISINGFASVDTFIILDFEKEGKYTVINYLGKELVSFPKVDDDEVEKPSANEEDGHISIFYNNKNWIFNVNTGKQLASFDSKFHYCVNDVSDDESIITLNSCVRWYESQDKTYYKFIKDGKLYDKTSECDTVTLYFDHLLCHKDYSKYLFDSNVNVGIDTYEKAYSSVKDSYVVNSTIKNYNVKFYQNGKFIKSVSCRDLAEKGYTPSDIYILTTHFDKTCGTESIIYEYYKSNGEKLIEKSFAHAEPFDSNNLAKVSEDQANYYMIDKTGKQIGNIYSNIFFEGEYYIITSNELKGIMNKEGKEIIPPTYSRAEVFTPKGRVLAVLKTDKNKYIVYDVDKNKEMFIADSRPDMNNKHYITATSNGKTQYYTFDGKMFYET